MKVKLIQYSPISMAIIGARICYDSFDRSDSEIIYYDKNGYLRSAQDLEEFKEMEISKIDDDVKIGENDGKLIKRLIQHEHFSPLEHIIYTFYISGISRLCLMELTRHRIASYSVQSTRYILKKIFKNVKHKKQIDEYFNYSPEIPVDLQRDKAFERLQLIKQLSKNYSNDHLKYLLPENLKTELVMTVNCRELRHILKLRLNKKAHFEIRELVKNIYNVLPEDHQKLLFFDINV